MRSWRERPRFGVTPLRLAVAFWLAASLIESFSRALQAAPAAEMLLPAVLPAAVLLFLLFGPWLFPALWGLRPVLEDVPVIRELPDRPWLPPLPLEGMPPTDAAARSAELASRGLAGLPAVLFAGWLGAIGGFWVRSDLLVALPGALAAVTCYELHPEMLAIGQGEWTAHYRGGLTHVMGDPLRAASRRSALLARGLGVPVVTVVVLPMDIRADRSLPAVLPAGDGESVVLSREDGLATVLRNLAAKPPAPSLVAVAERLRAADRSADPASLGEWRHQQEHGRLAAGPGKPNAGPADPRLGPCRECGGGMRLLASNKAAGTHYARCNEDDRHYRDLTLEEERRLVESSGRPAVAGMLDAWGTPRRLLWDGQAYILDGAPGHWAIEALPALLEECPGRLFGPHAEAFLALGKAPAAAARA